MWRIWRPAKPKIVTDELNTLIDGDPPLSWSEIDSI
jgi:hypothetical protein